MDEKKIDLPDQDGKYGVYGGRYVAETLVPALEELDKEYKKIKNNEEFQSEVFNDLRTFVGRPSPLYFAKRWSHKLGGARIFLKREDLNHTGAHKINNTVGQILLASTWARKELLLRLEQVSMALQRQQYVQDTDLIVLFIWAKKI